MLKKVLLAGNTPYRKPTTTVAEAEVVALATEKIETVGFPK
jgi:hypothetical protein